MIPFPWDKTDSDLPSLCTLGDLDPAQAAVGEAPEPPWHPNPNPVPPWLLLGPRWSLLVAPEGPWWWHRGSRGGTVTDALPPQDQLSADMYNFVAKEVDYANYFQTVSATRPPAVPVSGGAVTPVPCPRS